MVTKYLKKASLNSKMLLADIKRMQRLHGRDVLPEKIAAYVKERYYPKVGPSAVPKVRRMVKQERIWQVVLNFYRIQRKHVVGPRRFGEYTRARRAIMYLMLMRTPLTVTQVGKIFKRDHSTAVHNKKRLVVLMGKDDDVRREIEQLNRML